MDGEGIVANKNRFRWDEYANGIEYYAIKKVLIRWSSLADRFIFGSKIPIFLLVSMSISRISKLAYSS